MHGKDRLNTEVTESRHREHGGGNNNSAISVLSLYLRVLCGKLFSIRLMYL